MSFVVQFFNCFNLLVHAEPLHQDFKVYKMWIHLFHQVLRLTVDDNFAAILENEGQQLVEHLPRDSIHLETFHLPLELYQSHFGFLVHFH